MMGVLTFIPSRKFSNGYIDQAISGDVGVASQTCKIYSVLTVQSTRAHPARQNTEHRTATKMYRCGDATHGSDLDRDELLCCCANSNGNESPVITRAEHIYSISPPFCCLYVEIHLRIALGGTRWTFAFLCSGKR